MKNIIKDVRAWLRLFRAHTVILEAPLAVLGAALGLGTIKDPIIIAWLLFGIIYHTVGYGMNSYVDWKKGFDKEDSRKSHHPLNTGEISPESAKKVIMGGMGFLIVYGLALGKFSVIAFISVAVMVASGLTYNYYGKFVDLKFIPISITHTMVFIYPYSLYTEKIITPAFLLIASAYFIHHSFQIIISGDVKDMDQDEASLIKTLGARLGEGIMFEEKTFSPGSKVLYLAFSLCILQIGLAVSAVSYLGDILIAVPIMIVLGLWMVHEADEVIKSGPFDREDRVTHMSRKELAGYLMIHSALIPVISFKWYIIILASMLIYLVSSNYFLWGTFIKPRV